MGVENLKHRLDVLVAEGDPNQQHAVGTAFAQVLPKLSIGFVRDGQEIIDCLQKGQVPRLLLVDMHVARKTGFEVLKWLGENGWLKRLTVIVVSPAFSVVQMDLLMELGATACWVKPTDFGAMLSFVETLEQYATSNGSH